jgi:hypothetical protein
MNETNNQANADSSVFFKSLLQAQTELRTPTKNQTGYGYKYASLDQVIEIIKETLPKYGLYFIQSPVGEITNGCLQLQTMIYHQNGQSITREFEFPIKQGTNASQDHGAAITYARRYHLCCLLGLAADEDNDAAAAKKKTTGPKTNKPSSDAKKINPVRDESLVTAVEERLKHLDILDWAEGTKFTPHRTKEEDLKRFLALSDKDLLLKVNEWEATKEAA